MPTKLAGAIFKPEDLPVDPNAPCSSYSATPVSKWLVNGTIPGYWFCPGNERKEVQEVEIFRNSLRRLQDIGAVLTSEPIECTICIGGQNEPLFGEAWTLRFPDSPIIEDDLAPDHPLAGLNNRFEREKDPGGLAIMANQRSYELRNRKPRGGWTSVDWIGAA